MTRCSIPPTADSTNATVDQVRRLVAVLGDSGDVAMFVFDAGYDPIALGYELADTRAQVLCRIRDDRVSTPRHRHARTVQPAPGDARHATGHASNAPTQQHGPNPPITSSSPIPATAPSPFRHGTDSTRD